MYVSNYCQRSAHAFAVWSTKAWSLRGESVGSIAFASTPACSTYRLLSSIASSVGHGTASLSAVAPTGAGVHFAMPRTHLYATLVGVGFLEHPSAGLAPVAICHAMRFEVATALSRVLALSTATLASEATQLALTRFAALHKARAQRVTAGCCCFWAVLASAWCAVKIFER